MPDDTTVYLTNHQLVREMYEHRERVREQQVAHEREVARFCEESRAQFAAHQARIDQAIASRLRVYGWGGALAVVAGLLGLILGYFRLEREYHDALHARLDVEFGAPRIRRTIEETARQAAEVVATQQLQPQVEQAKASVAEVKAATEYALAPLERLRTVLELQGRAAAFSREAYDKLGELAESSQDPAERGLADGARQIIDGANAFQHWLGDPDVVFNGRPMKFSEVPTDALLAALKPPYGDPPQQQAARGRAANILAHKGERQAVPLLIKLVKPSGETNLISLADELAALHLLVPNLPTGTSRFSWKPVVEWWKMNRKVKS